MDLWLNWADALGDWGRELSGYAASALVLATFSMQSMASLRLTAIASNLAFILYAWVAHLHPILMLHGVLLPLNIIRLVQMRTANAKRVCPDGRGMGRRLRMPPWRRRGSLA